MRTTTATALFTLLATIWSGAATAQDAPMLAMVTPQSRSSWVAVDNQTVSTVKATRAGSRVSVAEDGIAMVGLPGAGGSIQLLGAIDEQGQLGVGGTDYSQTRVFSLASGLAIVVADTATENIQLNAGGRVLTIQRGTALVRVRSGALLILVSSGAVLVSMGSGNAPLAVAAGQWVTLTPDMATAKALAYTWPESLEAFGLGRRGQAIVSARLGGRSTSSGGPTLFQLFLVGLFVMQLVQVVYPKFGDRAVAAACVALLVECWFGLSRVWLKVGDTPLPAGAMGTALLVLAWVVAEEHARQGRTSVRTQFVSHVTKCVLVWVLSLLIGHGVHVFSPASPQNAVRLARTQVTVASSDESPIVTSPAQVELQTWEAVGMLLPALYLVIR